MAPNWDAAMAVTCSSLLRPRSARILCSFCGKSHNDVKKLIAGPGIYICDNCINLCKRALDQELAPEEAKHRDNTSLTGGRNPENIS